MLGGLARGVQAHTWGGGVLGVLLGIVCVHAGHTQGVSRPTRGVQIHTWGGGFRPTPKGGCPGPGWGAVSQHAPRQTTTAAGGTHPTGMHSCRS